MDKRVWNGGLRRVVNKRKAEMERVKEIVGEREIQRERETETKTERGGGGVL